MDVKTRWWLIGAATSAALVAIAILPPRACSTDERSLTAAVMCAERPQEWTWWGAKHSRLVGRVHATLASALERRMLAESVLARSAGPRAIRSSTGVTVVYEPPIGADSARRWLAMAEEEIAMLPPGGAPAPVVVYLSADSVGGLVRRLRTSSVTEEQYRVPVRFAMEGRDGAVRCVAVLPVSARAGQLARRGGVLDWCALYARYGAPGAGVARWASGVFRWDWRWGPSLAEQVAGTRGIRGGRAEGAYLWQACARGAAVPCEVLTLLRPSVPSGTSVIDVEWVRSFLAWMIATEGGERFGRMWRSDESMREAMTAVTGRPAADVVGTWVRQTVRVDDSPTGTRPHVLLASAVWASLSLAAAFVAMQRRQVG